MDEQFISFLDRIKSKVWTCFDKFILFFNLYTLIKHGIIGVPSATHVIFGLASLYVLSPIDLIPDFIPIIGYLDDLAVLGIVFGRFASIIQIGKAVIKAREHFHKNKETRIFEEKECMICYNSKPEVVFSCGHKICCRECQRIGNFRNCFICKN